MRLPHHAGSPVPGVVGAGPSVGPVPTALLYFAPLPEAGFVVPGQARLPESPHTAAWAGSRAAVEQPPHGSAGGGGPRKALTRQPGRARAGAAAESSHRAGRTRACVAERSRGGAGEGRRGCRWDVNGQARGRTRLPMDSHAVGQARWGRARPPMDSHGAGAVKAGAAQMGRHGVVRARLAPETSSRGSAGCGALRRVQLPGRVARGC